MCTEFIQALLLLLFTCYHLFCQEHPKGFMLWPFAYCSFSHERWSINKHQGVWKCARRGKQTLDHTKKVSILWRLILKTFWYICSIQTLYIQTMSIFIRILSLSLCLSQYVSFSDSQPTDVTTHIVYHLASLHITKHQILLLYYLDNLIPPQLRIFAFNLRQSTPYIFFSFIHTSRQSLAINHNQLIMM